MKKVLIPIDGTDRGLKAVEFAKGQWGPEEASFILLTVREDVGASPTEAYYEEAKADMAVVFQQATELLPGYKVHDIGAFGRAGDHILDTAEQEKVDAIVMTKSTRKGWHKIIGSVTAHVVKYATTMIMIVPE